MENIPGKVVNTFRARSTIQRIHGIQQDDREVNVALDLSKRIYNERTNSSFRYPTADVYIDDLFDLLLAEDVEEIVNLYLQVEKGYLLYSQYQQAGHGNL